jgi:hypothetical protein
MSLRGDRRSSQRQVRRASGLKPSSADRPRSDTEGSVSCPELSVPAGSLSYLSYETHLNEMPSRSSQRNTCGWIASFFIGHSRTGFQKCSLFFFCGFEPTKHAAHAKKPRNGKSRTYGAQNGMTGSKCPRSNYDSDRKLDDEQRRAEAIHDGVINAGIHLPAIVTDETRAGERGVSPF